MKIPIEVSARHIHLCQEHLEGLFGKGYKLTPKKKLTQPGQFSAQETIDLKSNNKVIKGVRIVGPCREKTQVELSYTDAINLNIGAPLRKSGDLKGSPGITLVASNELEIEEGVIIPWRHIHLNPKEADQLGLGEEDFVSVEVRGKRQLIFNKVQIRIDKNFKLCMHLDTDEGNACGLINKGEGKIIYA